MALCSFVVGASGCDDSGTGNVAPLVVTPTDAFTAIVQWEIAQSEPITNDDGGLELPVIYVSSAGGGTIDVGIQAAVAETTTEDAVVRFADDGADAVDDEIDTQPVKDDGVMLVVGEMPDPARTVDVTVGRYRSLDDDVALTMTIEADGEGAQVISTQRT